MKGPIKVKFSKKKKLTVLIDNNHAGLLTSETVTVVGFGSTEQECYEDAIHHLYDLRQTIDAAIGRVKKTFNPDHCGLSHHVTCTCKGEGGDR
jgi:hypothetical protein